MIFSSFKWKNNQTLHLSNPKSAFVYYKNSRKNLLTDRIEPYDFEKYLNELDSISVKSEFTPRVIHFYFESGYIFNQLGQLVSESDPLVLDIEYEEFAFQKLNSSYLKKIKLNSLERPSWMEYRNAFNQIQENLINGDCYQVNLTCPYSFTHENFLEPQDLKDFLLSRKQASSFAHITSFHEEVIFSNSPECLFLYENEKIKSLPIKGTVKQKNDFKSSWSELTRDRKQESELFMIIDLIKNDLNKIDGARTKVIKKKAPLLVPGLLHQYGLLELKLLNNVSFLYLIQSLFPGGSVTGAPKKRVLEIISIVEQWKRGIYTGSTVLFWKKKKFASINIRTAHIDLSTKEWKYGAGGGITLLSKAAQEFNEMEAKVDSFLTLLSSP